jgi:hypothetical protein
VPLPRVDPWGLRPAQGPRRVISSGDPLVAFRSSPESYGPGAAAPGYPSRRLPPMRSLPLRRFPVRGQPLTSRGYQPPGYGAFSAFLTLSRLSSAHGLPALFHAGPVLGVLPSRVDFRSRSRVLFRKPLPSCGSFLRPRRCFCLSGYVAVLGFGSLSQTHVNEAVLEPRHSTSRPCSPRASVPLTGGLNLPRGRNPHGLLPP